MSQNDTNNPNNPPESEMSLKEKRRQLEELTPNITSKQLGEQMSRLKRQSEGNEDVPPDAEGASSAVADPVPETVPPTLNAESDAASPVPEPVPETPPPATTDAPSLEIPVSPTPADVSVQPTPSEAADLSTNAPVTETSSPTVPTPTPSDDHDPEIALTRTTESLPVRIDTALLTADEAAPLAEQPVPEPVEPSEPVSPGAETPDKAPPTVDADADPAQETENSDEAAVPASTDAASDEAPAPKIDDQQAGGGLLNKHDTAVLSGKSPVRRALQKASTDEYQTASLGENREIILVIRGMVERLVLKEEKRIILGRTDVKSRFLPDVDLTPYGALDRGVSREHASLHLEEDRLYVTDLNSTNGTFLSGERLEPNQPAVLRKGDELLLGRLPVQVLFR